MAQTLSILSHFPQEKNNPIVWNVQIECINHSRPWAYFDGASQNDGQVCGGGIVLHLSSAHHFNITMGLVQGSNNYAKLMALKLLLIFVGEKGIDSLQVFGDSMVVINWIRKSQVCHNIRLSPLLNEVLTISNSYRVLSFHHVYREQNEAADKLSKEGLQLALGTWKMKQSNAGTIQ
jgi:ribonuclease HI